MFVAIIKSDGKLMPSDQFPRVYRTLGHVRAAMTQKGHDWAFESETPDLLMYKPQVPQSGGRRGYGKNRFELYKLTPTNVRLCFVRVDSLVRERLAQLT